MMPNARLLSWTAAALQRGSGSGWVWARRPVAGTRGLGTGLDRTSGASPRGPETAGARGVSTRAPADAGAGPVV